LLGDHLGSTDVLLDDAGATVGRTSFTPTGGRRGSNWSTGTAPDWLAIANSTRQGYTGHEMLDNVGLVHMNGRVYDPQLARFLSADPLIGHLDDSQSVHPYAYVGNRPLNATDPTGLVADGGASLVVANFLVNTIFSSLVHGILHGGSGLPPPPATALPGSSAQSGTSLCGAGPFSPTCGGQVLYATAPSTGAGQVPTSTWAETSVDDAYAQENLERFFADLGINAVEVLILSPVRDAQDAYAAAKRGDVATAIVYVSFTICDVAKPCQSVLAPTKALRRLGKAADNHPTRRVRDVAATGGGTDVVQRAMSRAELRATESSGLLRGGRPGTHYVSDAINSSAHRTKQRLALPGNPEVRVTLEVPRGTLSDPSRVAPAFGMPGGGLERTGTGEIPVRVLRVDPY
jgi:RHS repeat-associated protein